MNLVYSEHLGWSFQHWMDLELTHSNDDLLGLMDLNQWCIDHCGEVGGNWGYERKQITLPHPPGLNPVRVKLQYTVIQYSWRFKNKDDAMLFKLTWGGV